MSPLRLTKLVAVACLVSGVDAPAQSVFAPDSQPGPYVHQATLPRSDSGTDDEFGRRLTLRGDTALVAGTGIVYVFDRVPGTDTWIEGAPIAGGAIEEFGRAIAFDGSRAIVGAEGAAYLFRRNHRGVWREVARLLPPEGASFGLDVDIDGDHAIIARSGGAHIFRRDAGAWKHVTTLSVALASGQVAIGGDTAIVTERNGGSIFRRDDGSDDWTLVRRFSSGGFVFAGDVDVSADTIVYGGGETFISPPVAFIFGRNQEGPNAWGREATYAAEFDPLACCPTVRSVAISNDLAILGTSGPDNNAAHILARNQGGTNAWRRISLLKDAFDPGQLNAVSISGDTALIGTPGRGSGSGFQTDPSDNAAFIVVSDLDGDGLRDGVDPCVHDPLNDKHCRRDLTSLPIVDHLIVRSAFETSVLAPRRVTVMATFTNTSSTAIKNPFFAVSEITDGARLLNGDGLDRGVGATLSPDVGDGILSPGESTTVTFQIRLAKRGSFDFRVDVHGDVVP